MDLIITLGHNSSAILLEDNSIVAGYEEERFTRDKRTSNFPKQSVEAVLNMVGISENNTMYVSHWFDDFDFYKKYNAKIAKYWDYEYVKLLVDKYNFKIVTLDDEMTHHDAHAYSVLAFYNQFKSEKNPTDGHVLVADGFGNMQEVISIYEYDKTKIKLIDRVYGYDSSLGLMYQFATSYCGMKEKQDEYKFLGYEPEIDNLNINLSYSIDNLVEKFIEVIEDGTNIPNKTRFIDINALDIVRKKWYDYFDSIISHHSKKIEMTELNKRIIIANLIQGTIEKVNVNLIRRYKIKNVLLSGGIYYNVKLNKRILDEVETFSVIPVAGDQGVGIGLYYKDKKAFDFSNLCFGKRKLEKHTKVIPNVHYFNDKEELSDFAGKLIKENKIPEIVFGDMEFGPRALCHTSTLCLPTKENVSFINRSNNRNEKMPMAPILLEENSKILFKDNQIDKVVGSDKYMIITFDYNKEVSMEKYNGVMHKYPKENRYSGRPQIINDENSTVYKILKKSNSLALVNTSYNIHGKPIVFTVEDAISDFEYQMKHSDDKNRLHLLIGLYDE